MRAASAFENAPAIVSAAGHDVDFLARVLSDIGHVELSRQPVERKTPGVPETICEDFVAARNTAEERVRWGRAVGAICINAKHLAENLRQVLSRIAWIVPGTAVAHADVQVTVRSGREHSCVM